MKRTLLKAILLPLAASLLAACTNVSLREQAPLAVTQGTVIRDVTVVDTRTGALSPHMLVRLEGDRIAGYAADVFSMEDWALPDRPRQVSSRLLDNHKTVLTPHLGSAVDRVRRDIALQAAESLLQALRGEVPAGAVNRPSSPRCAVLP